MLYTLIIVGLVVIAGLGFYAGNLLFKLRRQTQLQTQARHKRIESIEESIRTIALAMQQQQCNLSEGVIRLVNLLEAIPVKRTVSYETKFPAVHKLYANIQHFPTHEARNQLTKAERRRQDREREQVESEFETDVIKELDGLRNIEFER